MLIELDHCAFGYRPGQLVVRVQGQVALERGSCLGVYGPNGSGKSTLLRGMLGLLAPMEGAVHKQGLGQCGYLPQHRGLDLHWPMTALDAASLAVSARRRLGWVGGARRRVRQMMASLNVGAFEHKSFAMLSGGQQQRVLLAGALADEPELLVLDEPTDDLDAGSRRALLERIAALLEAGASAVMVSHEPADLREVCDRVLALSASAAPGQPNQARLVPIATMEAEHRRVPATTSGGAT